MQRDAPATLAQTPSRHFLSWQKGQVMPHPRSWSSAPLQVGGGGACPEPALLGLVARFPLHFSPAVPRRARALRCLSALRRKQLVLTPRFSVE